MRFFNFWRLLMPVMLLFAAFTTTACSSDDDPEPEPTPIPVVDKYEVSGSNWEELHSFSDGSAIIIRISFYPGNTAVYQVEEVEKNGETTTSTSNYTYRRSGTMIILTPTQSGNATLECRLDDSAIKMEVYNTSNSQKIATMYKK